MALLWFKWLLGIFIFAHPFYVSVTEVNHNAKDKTVEVSCKIFADDMEDVLKKNFKTAVDLSDQSKMEKTNQLMEEYMRKHLTLSVNGKQVALSYLGFEKDREAVYVYLEGQNVPSVKTLDLTNSLLQDLTDQQINIMHVTVAGERKSHKLDHPKKQVSFSF